MAQGKYPPPILQKRILGLSKIKLLTYIQQVYNACPNFSLPHTPIPNLYTLKEIKRIVCSWPKNSFFRCLISDWIYENMALVSVYRLEPYRSYAKCVLGIKTLTWPSPQRTMGDCPHLPLSSAIIMIIILIRGLIQLARAIRKRQLPVKTSTEHYWRGCVKTAPSYPTSFDPLAWSTHPLFVQPPNFLDTGLQANLVPTF